MRRDLDAGPRRYSVVYTLVMQGTLVLLLIGLMWFQRDDRKAVLQSASFLVIPVAWAFAVWTAWRREEAARSEGAWGRERAQVEKKRTTGIMGGAVLAAVVLALAVSFLL